MIELTAALRKTVASLDNSRHREASGMFKAEGVKLIADTIPFMELRYLMVARDKVEYAAGMFPQAAHLIVPCSKADLERMSSLTTPREMIAVYAIPPQPEPSLPPRPDELILALDDIRDPGNMGTILRMAAWMGISQVWCSKQCVDIYNPKVVQSTMGAIAHVKVIYCDLSETIWAASPTPVYGTFLYGENIYTSPLTPGGIIIVGNEGHGISALVGATVTHRLTIPSFASGTEGESLNAAVAASITVAEFRRRKYFN